MLHELGRIRKVLFKRRVCAKLPQQSMAKQFYQGRDSGLEESNTVQLKNLSSEKTKSMNLAKRIIKHKLASYVSAIANHSGGRIYYGIDDHGIVLGESLCGEDEIEQIKTKVRNAI